MLASFVQSTLGAVERHDPALGAAVRTRLSAATREALAQASAISFVPIGLDVELTEALFECAGEERAREILRDNLAASFDAPFLHSFVSAALRVLGRSPERLMKWAPKVWGQIYRNGGEMRFVSEGEGAARLELEHLPPAIAASRRYLVGMAASVEAGFALADVDGEAVLVEHDPAAGRAAVRLAWKPRPHR
jgi:hypothetical protein